MGQFGFVESNYLAAVFGDFRQYFSKTIGTVDKFLFNCLNEMCLLRDDSFLVFGLGSHVILTSIVGSV